MLSQANISASTPMGATPLPSGGVTFLVWAPRATDIYLNGTFGANTYAKDAANGRLSKDASGFWSGHESDASTGSEYTDLRGENVLPFLVNDFDRVLAFHRWLDGSGQDVVVVASFAEQTAGATRLASPSDASGGRFSTGETKTTASARPVPLHPGLVQSLKEWKQVTVFKAVTDFLFPSPGTTARFRYGRTRCSRK
jgi:hypothetical protein